MIKQFLKKSDKMSHSSVEPSHRTRFQFSPPGKSIKNQDQQQTQFFLSQEKQLDHSFVTEKSQISDNLSTTLKTVGNASVIVHSEEKSEVSFKSEVELVRRKTQGFLIRPQKIEEPLPCYNQNIRNLLPSNKFKAQFTSIIQDNINLIFNNGMSRLVSLLGAMQIEHPYIQVKTQCLRSFSSCSEIMDLWIQDFQFNKRFILSFDFLFSHTGLVLSLLFYYSQLTERTANPLLSLGEEMELQKRQGLSKRNILKILFQYIWHRSRDLRAKPFVAKILQEFYIYLNNQIQDDQVIYDYCERSREVLTSCLKYQNLIKDRFEDGKQCAKDHLEQICINYEEKDKLIRDNVMDIAELFNQVVGRSFVNFSLGFFYETNQYPDSKKGLARKNTLLTCWLLKILINKSRTNGNLGIEYLQRYIQLCKIFMQKYNLQSLQLFTSLILITKQYMPTLWKKFKEKRKTVDLDTQLQTIFKFMFQTKLVIDKDSKQSILFQFVRIFRIVEIVKERYKQSGSLNILFHQDIQKCARKIMHFRKITENQLMNDKKNNRSMRMNMNYRFLSFYIYQIIQSRVKCPERYFESLKEEMGLVDKDITFPFLFF